MTEADVRRDTDAGLGRSVAATVADLDALHDRCAIVLNMAGLYSAAKALARGTPIDQLDFSRSLFDEMPPDIADIAANLMHTTAVWNLWETRRVVYAVHPQLADDLTGVTWDRMPASVIDRLPHDTPLTVFAEPVTVPTAADERPAAALGFVLTGVDTHNDRYCDIHDPDRTLLKWTFFLDHEDRGVLLSMGMPTPPGATLDVNDVADPTVTDLRLDDLTNPEWARAFEPERTREVMTPLLRLGMATTVYLCSRNPDTTTSHTPVRRRARTTTTPATKRRSKPATVVEVGWRLAPPLPSPRRDTTTDSAPTKTTGATTGKTVRPHQRRGHPHLYWTGPGRQIPEIKRLARIDVNKHLGTPETTTIVPVRATEPTGTSMPPGIDIDAIATASAAHRSRSHSAPPTSSPTTTPEPPLPDTTDLGADEALGA